MYGLKDKVVVVAGGATGIGAGVARRLAEEGAVVVVGDLNVEGAEQTAAHIRAELGARAKAIQFDIGDEHSVRALIDGTVEKYGRLDGVHANAADLAETTIGHDTDIIDMDITVWDRTLTMNLRGHMLVARFALPHLLAIGGGGIVFTSSGEALVGSPHRPAYAASKAGVNALARHISGRWGKKGIRANAVLPGYVLTEKTQMSDPEMQKVYLKLHRSPRLGSPSDIAAMVALLLSDDGEWINGQTIEVNGGAHLTTG